MWEGGARKRYEYHQYHKNERCSYQRELLQHGKLFYFVRIRCSCDLRRQEDSCGPLLGGFAVAHARRWHPAFLSCFTSVLRVRSMISYVVLLVRMRQFVRTWYHNLPVCHLSAVVVSSLLFVCCCASYVAMMHSWSRVASDSTTRTLDVNRQLLAAWLALHILTPCVIYSCILRCVTRCLFMFRFFVVPGILCSTYFFVYASLFGMDYL